MRNKFIIFLFVTVGLIFTSSCSDFLDVVPRDEVSINQQFSTYQGTLQALNGAYSQTEVILSGWPFVYADLQGGNISFTPNRTGSNQGIIAIPSALEAIYNFNDQSVNSVFNSVYSGTYSVINNLNNILKFVDLLTDANEIQKNQVKAEALAMRAFLHFQLLQWYSQTYLFTPNASHLGIVYADRILIGGVDFPERLSVNESYEKVIQDYTKALSLFSDNAASPGPVYSYFNKINTKALLAKAYLYSNQNALALSTAQQVISESNVSLMPKNQYIAEWEKPNAPVSEVLFELTAPLDATGSVVSSSVSEYYLFINNQVNYGRLVASGDLLEIFEQEDVRGNNFIEASLQVKVGENFENQPFYFTKKFQDNPGTLVMRLSEVYLIAAEAAARSQQNVNALFYLNSIRNRAGLNDANGVNLLEEIFMERRRELCFEGNLLYDIARFGKNITRNLGCISQVCNLNFPNPRFILPLPLSTIIINENMQQNETY